MAARRKWIRPVISPFVVSAQGQLGSRLAAMAGAGAAAHKAGLFEFPASNRHAMAGVPAKLHSNCRDPQQRHALVGVSKSARLVHAAGEQIGPTRMHASVNRMAPYDSSPLLAACKCFL